MKFINPITSKMTQLNIWKITFRRVPNTTKYRHIKGKNMWVKHFRKLRKTP